MRPPTPRPHLGAHTRLTAAGAGLAATALLVLPAGPAQAAFTSGPTPGAPGSSWTTGAAPAAPGSLGDGMCVAQSGARRDKVSWAVPATAMTYALRIHPGLPAGPVPGTTRRWDEGGDTLVAGITAPYLLMEALNPGTSYDISVQASNGFESDWSNTVSTGIMPAPAWSQLGADLGAGSSPVVAPDGTLYAGTEDGHIYRWDGTTWQVMGGSIGVDAYPAVAPDGTLYAGSDRTSVYRWDGTAWQALPGTIPSGWTTATVAPDGTLYSGSGDGSVYQWTGTGWVALGGQHGVHSVPLVAPDGTLYTGQYDDGHVYRWTGLDWQAATDSVGAYALPLVTRTGVVFATSDDGYMHRWDGTTWSVVGGYLGFRGDLVVAPDDTIYSGSIDGIVRRLDGLTLC